MEKSWPKDRKSKKYLALEAELKSKKEELQLLRDQLQRSEKCSAPEIVIKK